MSEQYSPAGADSLSRAQIANILRLADEHEGTGPWRVAALRIEEVQNVLLGQPVAAKVHGPLPARHWFRRTFSDLLKQARTLKMQNPERITVPDCAVETVERIASSSTDRSLSGILDRIQADSMGANEIPIRHLRVAVTEFFTRKMGRDVRLSGAKTIWEHLGIQTVHSGKARASQGIPACHARTGHVTKHRAWHDFDLALPLTGGHGPGAVSPKGTIVVMPKDCPSTPCLEAIGGHMGIQRMADVVASVEGVEVWRPPETASLSMMRNELIRVLDMDLKQPCRGKRWSPDETNAIILRRIRTLRGQALDRVGIPPSALDAVERIRLELKGCDCELFVERVMDTVVRPESQISTRSFRKVLMQHYNRGSAVGNREKMEDRAARLGLTYGGHRLWKNRSGRAQNAAEAATVPQDPDGLDESDPPHDPQALGRAAVPPSPPVGLGPTLVGQFSSSWNERLGGDPMGP